MNKQSGWTIWSMLLSVSLVIFFALLIMKLGPHYMDNYKLQAALESVTEDPRVTSMTRRQVVQEIKNILYIDYGGDIVNLNESLIIDKAKGSMNFTIEYEVVVHIAGNVSALLEFENTTSVLY